MKVRPTECENTIYLSHGKASLIYTQYDNHTGSRVVTGPGAYRVNEGEWIHTFSWSHPTLPAMMISFITVNLLEDNVTVPIEYLQSVDGEEVNVTLHIYYKITDLIAAAKEEGNPIQAMRTFALRDVSDFIGSYIYDVLIQNRTKLCLITTYPCLCEFASRIGFKVTKVVGVLDTFKDEKKYMIL